MEKKVFESRNPYSGVLLTAHKSHSQEEVQELLAVLVKAQKIYRRSSYKERADKLTKLGTLLEANKATYAQMITGEMGKPIGQAIAEIEKCAVLCDYYASNLEMFLKDEQIKSDAASSYVRHDPLGVVLGIMPWNFPFWQVIRFAIPTLASGNAVVLKHASNVCGCAALLEAVIHESGFQDLFFHVRIASGRVPEILAHEGIHAVSLTGSESAGKSVGSLAGQYLKPALLELGGSNSFIVLSDADIPRAVQDAVRGRFQNNGQSCIAAKRIFVARDIYRPFMELFTTQVNKLKCGDPADMATDIGPLAKDSFNHDLLSQMDHSIAMGARRLLGGCMDGNNFLPTILDNVRPGMPVFDEETFGPLAAVSIFDTIEEAIELHNKSKYGLGVSIYTSAPDKIMKFLPDIKDGGVFFNSIVFSDPRLPFGGTGNSGFGRELSRDGILAFVNRKTIVIT